MVSRWWFYPLIFAGSLALVALLIVILAVVLIYPNLPSIEAVTDYRPKLPLRVFTIDGDLIGEFGEEKRSFVKIQDFPAVMKQAIIAADGTVKNLTVISGHPLLVPAALEAVRQWVYQQTLLNGEPVEVMTQIDVNFTLLE